VRPQYHWREPMEFREAVGFVSLILDALLADDAESVLKITHEQLKKAQAALRTVLRTTDSDDGLLELMKESHD
jgi:hypothetical protein